MIAIVATSIILGGALGVRYSILVILPAIALALVVIALGGIARREELATIALAMATSDVALQLSYLAGCFGRLLLPPPASAAKSIDGIATAQSSRPGCDCKQHYLPSAEQPIWSYLTWSST